MGRTAFLLFFRLQHFNSVLFALLAHFLRPDRDLHLADVRFVEKQHTDAGLAETAADGKGQPAGKNALMEGQLRPLRHAGDLKLFFHRLEGLRIEKKPGARGGGRDHGIVFCEDGTQGGAVFLPAFAGRRSRGSLEELEQISDRIRRG